jgi:ketosteroid isomerase-like protein
MSDTSDDRGASHSTRITLTTDPRQHPLVFAAAFNSGDAVAVEGVYEGQGVLVTEPGRPVTGPARAQANTRLQQLGLPIEVRPRHVYIADDIALLIVDWSISGTGPDGRHVDIAGTATDVARRGPDGAWRYVIDNPFGTA